MRLLFHFFGSLPFALLLIASAAAFAVAGTFIESATESHHYAALFTYGSPFFSLLLWGFFVNILLSALRRYPFKKKHIPFLMTHLGMLMILAGVFIKTHFGIQGSLMILEGGGSDEIYFKDSYALYVEHRGLFPEFYTFNKNFSRYSRLIPSKQSDDSLEITLLDHTRHSQEKINSWIKGNTLSFFGIKPLPVFHLSSSSDLLPFFSIKLPQSSEPFWNMLTVRSDDINKIAEQAYIQAITVNVRNSRSEKKILQVSLQELLHVPFETPYGPLEAYLEFKADPPVLFIHLTEFGESGKIKIALNGDKALDNQYALPFLGKNKIAIDLSCSPTLLFNENSSGDITLFAFTKYGQIISAFQPSNSTLGILAYDDGFLGYSQEIKIPFAEGSLSRNEKEKATLSALKEDLKEAENYPKKLALPLQLLYQACQAKSQNFPEMAAQYFDLWNKKGGWLWSGESPIGELREVLDSIPWTQLAETGITKGCYWNARLFEHLDPLLIGKEQDLITILNQLNWPPLLQMNLASCPLPSWPFLLRSITLNLFSTAEFFPSALQDFSVSSARLFSAYLRAYDLHLSQIQRHVEPSATPLILETPLSAVHQAATPMSKLENNVPSILLRFKKGDREEKISLSYDKIGSGFKWPVLNGEYVVRFQPLFTKIPYHIRLREARQVTYPGSLQPFSFESDVLVTNKSTGESKEHQISMNNVLETWDGYRFYLANIAPSDPGALKQVQIVVNQDPAKYVATYPGALMMTLGIMLLFFRKQRIK